MTWWNPMSWFTRKVEEPLEVTQSKEKLRDKETEVIIKMYNQGLLDSYKELDDGYAGKTKRHPH